jgi:asparagine synthase (glutamine-hydrolysing)
MANFVVVVDPDLDRRSHFVQTIKPLLPPVEGLVTNMSAVGDFHCVWAANSNAPISKIGDDDGAAVIWGEAIVQGESTRMDAFNLRQQWKESPKESLPFFDGFHAIALFHPHFGLAVSADILGLFPIYYYTHKDVALVASSPELFRYHPLFEAEFNPAGLVGILLTNGLVDGQTLWKGVKRLDAGHSLHWQPSQAPKEYKQYEIPGNSENDLYSNLSFSEHLDILDQTLDETLKRHVLDSEKYALMLSGGLDSRMLAGFLHRQGKPPVTLTFGNKSDIEMQCAIPVARTLGLKHCTANTPLKEYSVYLNSVAKWEHLAGGCNGIGRSGMYAPLGRVANRVISGYSLGPIVGVKLAYSQIKQTPSFADFFSSGTNRWGLSPQLLNQLLNKETFDNLVPETLNRLQCTYNQYSDENFRRAWWFDIYHRQRFHIGCSGWKLCFGAWPTLPHLDWQLLKTTAVLPPKSVGNRQGQNQLVCTRFPKLAALPLDRNDFNVEPLLPSRTRQRINSLYKLQRKWRRWQNQLGNDRRYYYRTFDINNAGWREVRRQTEVYRQRVQPLFDSEVLDALLPTPEVSIQTPNDSIIEASGRKALLGFLLWSKENI